MSSEILVKGYKCLRCNHTWIPRKDEKPRRCSRCKNAYWDTPRRGHIQYEGLSSTIGLIPTG